MDKDTPSQAVVAGVLKALRQEFGDDYTYYLNDVPQNFAVPSFFIRTIKSSYNHLLGQRRYRTHTVSVTYFPVDEKHVAKELNELSDRLGPVLEIISVDDKLVAGGVLDMYFTDTELHAEINYNIFMWRTKPKPQYMATLELEITSKEKANG